MKPSRVRWDQLPGSVHHRVAEILGSPVSVDTLQTHGTTPGVASRVVTADGSHAFVKVGHCAINEDIPGLNRREATLLSLLPDTAPSPRLLGRIDVDGWVGLVTSDIEGPHPQLPWSDEDIDTALASLSRLAEVTAGFFQPTSPGGSSDSPVTPTATPSSTVPSDPTTCCYALTEQSSSIGPTL